MKFFCHLYLILVLWQSKGLCLHAQEKKKSEIPFEAITLITAITPRVDASAFSSSEVVVIGDGLGSVFTYKRQFIHSRLDFAYKSRLDAIMSIHQQTGLIGFR